MRTLERAAHVALELSTRRAPRRIALRRRIVPRTDTGSSPSSCTTDPEVATFRAHFPASHKGRSCSSDRLLDARSRVLVILGGERVATRVSLVCLHSRLRTSSGVALRARTRAARERDV